MLSEAIYSTLSDTTLVGGRLYPLQLPFTPTFPCATYEISQDAPSYNMQGATDLRQATIKVTVLSYSYSECRQASAEVEAAFANPVTPAAGVNFCSAFAIGSQDYKIQKTVDEDSVIYATSLKFDIAYE